MIDSFPASAPTDLAAPALLSAWGLAGEVEDLGRHAWQMAGENASADRVLASTTRDIEAIERELQSLRDGARNHATASMHSMRGSLFRAEASLASVVALAFGVAAFFSLSTRRRSISLISSTLSSMSAIKCSSRSVIILIFNFDPHSSACS
jgi:hypothetical protein